MVAQEPGEAGAGMRSPMTLEDHAYRPGYLDKPLIQGPIFLGAVFWKLEARQTRARAVNPIDGPKLAGPPTEREAVDLGIVGDHLLFRGPQGNAQIVSRGDGGRQQHDALHGGRRQLLGGSQYYARTAALAHKVDRPARISAFDLQHQFGELTGFLLEMAVVL